MKRLFYILALVPGIACAQHEPGTAKAVEHAAMLAYAANADMVVPAGQTVTLAGQVTAETIRVDGALVIADGAHITVGTLFVAPGGSLAIGTEADPAEDVRVDFHCGPIDFAADPMLLSRGLISHGTAAIFGTPKTTHLKVAADPMAGDAALTLAAVPAGWHVGDTIVVAGTRYDGYRWDNAVGALVFTPPQDEVRTIAAISGATVTLSAPLVHDHDTPRADLKTSVGNYSRSVRFVSECPVAESAHAMFMHSDAIDVRFAAFEGMGRTDKSAPAIPDDQATAASSNVKGRYPLHVHRAGAAGNPAVLTGNAVWHSPGWGIVHHDANAVLTGNVVYDAFGAGVVAESGNETGRWIDNLVIFTQGISWEGAKSGNDAADPNFDLGRTGDGFWFQGRLVEASGNIAASFNTGFVYFHRGVYGDGKFSKVDADTFEYPVAVSYNPTTPADRVPILHFAGNEAFAGRVGFHVVKANPIQGHDVHSRLSDFTAWNVRTGADIQYTAHYLLEDFDLVAKAPVQYSAPLVGFELGNNLTDITIRGGTIAGFPVGIEASRHFTFPFDAADAGLHVVGTTITGATTAMEGIDPAEVHAALPGGELAVDLDPLTYAEGGAVAVTGTKTDSLGAVAIPSGSDNYDLNRDAVIRILARDGWYETEDGRRVIVWPFLISDRGTGDIMATEQLIELDPALPLGHQGYAYRDAVYNGVLQEGDAAEIARLTAEVEALTAGLAAVNAELEAMADDLSAMTAIVEGVRGLVNAE